MHPHLQQRQKKSLLDKELTYKKLQFNYEKNVEQYFNPEHFYLKPAGLVVYFQQYEIAPYSSGIPEFTIPYLEEYVLRPQCQ